MTKTQLTPLIPHSTRAEIIQMFYKALTWMRLQTSHAPLQLPFPYAAVPCAVSSCGVLQSSPLWVQRLEGDKEDTHCDDAAVVVGHNQYLHCLEGGYSH
jgi:hypothetical protein